MARTRVSFVTALEAVQANAAHSESTMLHVVPGLAVVTAFTALAVAIWYWLAGVPSTIAQRLWPAMKRDEVESWGHARSCLRRAQASFRLSPTIDQLRMYEELFNGGRLAEATLELERLTDVRPVRPAFWRALGKAARELQLADAEARFIRRATGG